MNEFARDPNGAAFACLGVMFLLLAVLVALLWWHGRCYVRKQVVAAHHDARLLAEEVVRLRAELAGTGRVQYFRGDQQPLMDALWKWCPRPESKSAPQEPRT